MTQEVTIRISVQPDEGTSATTAVTESARAEPPRPAELQELRLGGGGEAPAPLPPDELSALATGAAAATTGGEAPGPLPIEQLETVSTGGAPGPEDLAAPGEEAAGPAPEPMSIEELEALGDEGDGDEGEAPANPRGRRRPQR